MLPFRLALAALPVAMLILTAAGVRADDADMSRAVTVMEGHVRALHDRLHVTAAQQPQWDAVANAMLTNARHIAALHEQMGNTPASAPADLRNYAAVAAAHAEDAQRMVAPFEQLYAIMTPEQRAAADDTFRRFERERLRKAGL